MRALQLKRVLTGCEIVLKLRCCNVARMNVKSFIWVDKKNALHKVKMKEKNSVKNLKGRIWEMWLPLTTPAASRMKKLTKPRQVRGLERWGRQTVWAKAESLLTDCGGMRVQNKQSKEGVGGPEFRSAQAEGNHNHIKKGQLHSNLQRVAFPKYLKVSVTEGADDTVRSPGFWWLGA